MDSLTTEEITVVVRELTIAAAPETVWEFLVDPARAERWMGVSAVFDPRPGGVYSVEVLPGHLAKGAFVELDRPRRLVFTWGWEPRVDGDAPTLPPGASTVEFELEPDGAGTRVRLTHHLPDKEAATRHAHGWDHYLPRLVAAAGGDDPGRDPWLD